MTPGTPQTASVLETLVTYAQELFWSYSGPATWDEGSETVCYDVFRATAAVLDTLSESLWWSLFTEQPLNWISLENVIQEWIEHFGKSVTRIYLEALAGQQLLDEQSRAGLRSIVTSSGHFHDEAHERVSDKLFADPVIKTEDDRRYALTGNPIPVR